MDVILKN